MTETVNQPTAAPTRKMTAVIIAGVVMGLLRTAIAIWAPEWDADMFFIEYGPEIHSAIMIAAGYFVKERAPEVIDVRAD